MMTDKRADFAIYSRNGRLVALVEVKNIWGTTSRWAAEFRRAVFQYDAGPIADFYLLVTPDKLYLWKVPTGGAELLPPDYEIDNQPLLKPYVEEAGLNPHEVGMVTFEFISAIFLSRLTRVLDHPQSLRPGESMLREAGFLDAIKGARIESEVAA